MPNPNDLFALPNMTNEPSYQNIMESIRSIGALPNMTQGVMPEIRGLLGQGGPAMAPGIAALRDLTNTNVAQQVSGAQQRGLTGSSIEAFGMGQAQAGGMQAESQFRAQGAQTLADLLFKAQAGDIQAATMLRQLIAQAMGQEMGAQRDIDMFNKQMEEARAQAAANRKAQLWAAGIGAVGQVGAAVPGALAA